MSEPGAAPKKDVWDRISALAVILVPAAIALAGHLISQGLKQAEIENEVQRTEQSRIAAEANMKISQAGLINTLMKSLTSSNPQERRLAVQAILIALPEQGLLFAQTVAETDEDKSVQDSARSSIEQRLNSQVRDLFADEKGTRISSAQELVQTWRDEPVAVSALVDYAASNKSNANGIYNTAVVLSELSPQTLAAKRDEVDRFLDLAKASGPRTDERLEILRKRMQR